MEEESEKEPAVEEEEEEWLLLEGLAGGGPGKGRRTDLDAIPFYVWASHPLLLTSFLVIWNLTETSVHFPFVRLFFPLATNS